MRAKIVKDAWGYKWSSASDHVKDREKGPIKLASYKAIKLKEWRDYLKENDPDMINEIRLKTNRGLVVGTDKFVKALEKRLNRSLKCLPQGGQRKGDNEKKVSVPLFFFFNYFKYIFKIA